LRSLQDRRGGAGTLRHIQIKSQHAGPGGLYRQRECRGAVGAGLVTFFQVAAAVSWSWWRVTKWWPDVANYPVKPLTSGV